MEGEGVGETVEVLRGLIALCVALGLFFCSSHKDGWDVLALPSRAVPSQLRSFFSFMTVTCRRALATPSPLHLSLHLVRLNFFAHRI